MTALDLALTDLGEHLDVPAAEHLSARVVAAAHDAPARRPTGRRVATVVAAAIAVVGLVGAPALADWLGLRGVRVTRTPAPVPALGSALDLGRRVDASTAIGAAGFPLRVPRSVGSPDEVWLDERQAGPVVTLLYRARPGLPVAHETDVGALLTQLRGSVDDEVMIHKFAGPGVVVEPVEIGGRSGLWIEGAHTVAFIDASGELVPERVRLANRVLLWEDGDLTLRLESALDREAAIALAETTLEQGTGWRAAV